MNEKTTNNNNAVNTAVATIKVSEEYADKLINDVLDLQEEVLNVANKNAVLISLKVCEALEQKVHWLKGFEDNTKGQCAFLEQYFSYDDKKWGDTQRKMANIIAHNFGRRVEGSTAYEVVSPNVLLYGESNLWEISKFADFDKDNFDKFVEDKGITPQTSKAKLKEMRMALEQKEEPKKDDTKKEEPNKEETTVDETLTSLKAENDSLHAKVENVKDDIAKLYQLALDKKVDDKKFRDEAKKVLSHLEKTYNNK